VPVSDGALTDEVHRLVCAHEVGGGLRCDLLEDADSRSYFDINLPPRLGGDATARGATCASRSGRVRSWRT
jgi:hypothetical protein